MVLASSLCSSCTGTKDCHEPDKKDRISEAKVADKELKGRAKQVAREQHRRQRIASRKQEPLEHRSVRPSTASAAAINRTAVQTVYSRVVPGPSDLTGQIHTGNILEGREVSCKHACLYRLPWYTPVEASLATSQLMPSSHSVGCGLHGT